ncbi:MAG: helix-turn-helix domain-containing protein [Turicibacter sp.]|uniref:helix-turn-helix domain-containing protein n=2 Tax=Turicibacter sp. H121 TaxID=1712675 RepID=UPI000AFD22A1|nr:helix-turn-helix domain-containing protein [Turicibacter sp. H121]MCU7199415.1 helix-turn-helix domain containing protein [Turicibacter sp. H121]MDD5985437.1 helix-turn-helix domain-containing protein [Turicibacter sp.]
MRQHKRYRGKRIGTKQTYAGKFKLNVLNDMKTTGASYSMTANHFEVSEIRTIANWNTKFLKAGIEALFRSKGRPRYDMTNPNQPKETKSLTCEQPLEDVK